MKRLLIPILTLLCCSSLTYGQLHKGKIVDDTTEFTGRNGTTEVILQLPTKDSSGALMNAGRGRLTFRRVAIRLNDSAWLIGTDTVIIPRTLSLPDLSGYELIANKESSLTTSTTHYPTSGAVKTYVDNGLSLKLNTSAAFTKTAADLLYKDINYVPTWSSLTGKPTSLSGYGIIDAYPLTGNPAGFLTASDLPPPASTLEDVLNNGHILNDYHKIGVSDNGLDFIGGDTTFSAGQSTEWFINNNDSYISAFDNDNATSTDIDIQPNSLFLEAYNNTTLDHRKLLLGSSSIAVSKKVSGTTTNYSLPLTVNNISAGTDNNITLNYLQPSDTTGKWQIREDQRLSSNNSPNFAGLTSNGIIKLLGLLNTPTAPATATQNMYADSTGAWTIQGSNGFAFSISKARLTGNHRVFVQNKDYTVADSADVAGHTSTINSYLITSATYTSGSTYTVANNTNWIIINPSATVSALAVTMPATPLDAQRVDFSFGGTMTTGTVITSFSVVGNSGQTVLQSSTPSSVQAGETISYRYKSSLSKWYRII